MDKFISCQRLVSVFSIRNVLVPRRSRIKFLVVPDKQTEVLSHRAPFIRYRDHSLARGFVKMRRTVSMRKKKCQLCNLDSGVRVRVFFFLSNTKQYLEYEDIRDVVLAVGSCAGFWDVCVLRLSWHVHKFASSLRPVARGMFVCLFFCFCYRRSIVKASDKRILLCFGRLKLVH